MFKESLTAQYSKTLNKSGINLLCAFDENFPHIDLSLRASEMPYLFAYRGDISLLGNLSRNVAVVGVLNPSEEVVTREKQIVRRQSLKKVL